MQNNINLESLNFNGAYVQNKTITFNIVNFDIAVKKETKKSIFMYNIHKLRNFIDEIKTDNRHLKDYSFEYEFKESALKVITKNTKKLINELIQDKVIINNNGTYRINNKSFYCVFCYDTELENNYFTKDKPNINKIYEYQKNDHLRIFHSFEKYKFNDEFIRPITEKDLNDYFVEKLPNISIHQHSIKTENIKNYRDKIEIEIKCENCDYSRTITEYIGLCKGDFN